MTWHLKAMAALSEDTGSILSTHMEAHSHLQLQLQEIIPSFWPLLAHKAHTYMQAKYSHKK